MEPQWNAFCRRFADWLSGDEAKPPTCANCKHWRNMCCNLAVSRGGCSVHETLAFAQCDELNAALVTEPDFSCIQWEPKE